GCGSTLPAGRSVHRVGQRTPRAREETALTGATMGLSPARPKIESHEGGSVHAAHNDPGAAVLALAVASPAHATAPFAPLFTVPGVITNGSIAPFFTCTNTDMARHYRCRGVLRIGRIAQHVVGNGNPCGATSLGIVWD